MTSTMSSRSESRPHQLLTHATHNNLPGAQNAITAAMTYDRCKALPTEAERGHCKLDKATVNVGTLFSKVIFLRFTMRCTSSNESGAHNDVSLEVYLHAMPRWCVQEVEGRVCTQVDPSLHSNTGECFLLAQLLRICKGCWRRYSTAARCIADHAQTWSLPNALQMPWLPGFSPLRRCTRRTEWCWTSLSSVCLP